VAFFSASEPLARALAQRGYIEPTPVQLAVLQESTGGRDLLVSAQTGSGKTVAYGLAIGATTLNEPEALRLAGKPTALIVAPTRELALQVQAELHWLYADTGAQVVSCVGGMDPRREARRLAQGCHIVVGTPGRLRDHLERGALNVSALKAVVLDEADEMLDLGFREDLEFILEATPPERRTLLFSATLPKPIIALARRYQRDALRIEVAGGERGHADIDYRAVRVAPNEIEHAVVNLLRYFEAPSALVFCNTREAVRHLNAVLQERGFAAVSLSGEMSQSERNLALQAVRDKRARVCVATDVAARGIDLPDLGLVIHRDLPHDAATFQHRSGRTGRAGRKGVSVLVVPLKTRARAERILAAARVQPLWSGPPSADEIYRLDHDRLLQDPNLVEPASEEDLAAGRALLAHRSAEEIATAFIRFYRSHLPAPEELFDPGPQRPIRERREVATDRKTGRAEHRSAEGFSGVWFRISVGHQNNADPRWLIPLICRRGKVTKAEIGAIRVLERETRFEIARGSAERFARSVRKSVQEEVQIEPVAEGPRRNRTGSQPRRARAGQ
jgi:ATP-dependent RNA helicase DeaD